MDWWIVKQLRAMVITDLREFVPSGHFENTPANLTLATEIKNHRYFTYELGWAHAAQSLGRSLFFEPKSGMSARQVSASDVLMNLGLLASAQAMHGLTAQISADAKLAGIPDGNASVVKEQLASEHIPTFLNNVAGALEQYLHYLPSAEKAPFLSLLNQAQQQSQLTRKLSEAIALETGHACESKYSRTTAELIPVDINTHVFDVALSFPGEARSIVEQVATELEKRIGPNSYFYDNNYISQLARPSLDVLLQDIYRNRARLVVVFLSKDYQRKEWCGVEFRAIKEILHEREHERIMFVRTDEGSVDGVFKTDGYVDARRFNAMKIAQFIQERVLLAKLPNISSN